MGKTRFLFVLKTKEKFTVTLLTAYNKDVQRYFQGGYCNTAKKKLILSALEERVFEMGKSFSKLFPNKKELVLDEIIYLLSGTGICKIGAERLAEKVGCSVRTVKGAVASLKETNQILVARLADDNAGKYIFVYKDHPNFKQILNEVFFIDSLPESDEIALPFAPQFAPLQNAKPVETVSVEGEKSTSNYINLFNSLQEKDSIQQHIENDLQDPRKNQEKTKKKLQQYHANEFQLILFDEIMTYPFPDSIKEVAGTLALRAGMDCNAKRIPQAIQMLTKIALNMASGIVIDNVVAVFSEGMTNKRYLNSKGASAVINQSETKPKVQFYNWLEDRI